MIQKINNHDEIRNRIQQTCKKSIGFFVNNVPLSRSNFPILQLTFTIWRKYAYQQLSIMMQQNQSLSGFIIKIFHALSQKKYLPIFIQRVQKQMNTYSRGLRNVEEGMKQLEQLPKQEELLYQLIIDLGRSVWQQQLYLQLIQDLIRLPYLSVISPKSSIVPRQDFATDYIFRQQKVSKFQNVANKAGKSIFNKVLTALTETVFSKTFIIRINTLFGSFNPLVIGATFGLSRYLQYLDKKNEQDKLQVQIKLALQLAQKKLNNVKQIYTKCLQKIELIMSESENQQNKTKYKQELKVLFLTVFEEQWLQIEVVNQDDGWQVVRFQQKESFQQI